MFPRTIEIQLKIGRYVPILRHQSASIEPCRVGRIDVKGGGIRRKAILVLSIVGMVLLVGIQTQSNEIMILLDEKISAVKI